MSDNTTGAMQQFGTPAAPGGSSGAGPRAGLVLLYADEYASLPGAWPFDRKRLVIGREESADLVIGVHSVSRRHAEVSFEGGSWVLRDLGSRNGTLVDGQRISVVPLESGHEVRVGDVVLKYVEKNAESLAGYRLDGVMLSGLQRRCKRGTTLVGGYQMDRVAADVERIAASELSVMLLGESGTGKEVVARELHRLSGRQGQFNAVNCAAIPGTLLESELFGYKRGAFSGAQKDKPGLIQGAHGGTLLLDEIGDMPLDAQAKLLRVLQSKEVFPLGATQPERVDVRVVCATHRDLQELQQQGTFREDLFARLNEYQLRLPPLRERKEDVFMLMASFLARHGRPDLRASFQFMLGLVHYDWPYNVRELEACIKRCIALAEGPTLDAEQLPPQIAEAMSDYGRASTGPSPASVPPPPSPAAAAPAAPHVPQTPYAAPPNTYPGPAPAAPAAPAEPRTSAPPSEAELRELLRQHAGNVAAVGRQLGKARMQVHRWMKRYNIQVDDYRA